MRTSTLAMLLACLIATYAVAQSDSDIWHLEITIPFPGESCATTTPLPTPIISTITPYEITTSDYYDTSLIPTSTQTVVVTVQASSSTSESIRFLTSSTVVIPPLSTSSGITTPFGISITAVSSTLTLPISTSTTTFTTPLLISSSSMLLYRSTLTSTPSTTIIPSITSTQKTSAHPSSTNILSNAVSNAPSSGLTSGSERKGAKWAGFTIVAFVGLWGGWGCALGCEM